MSEVTVKFDSYSVSSPRGFDGTREATDVYVPSPFGVADLCSPLSHIQVNANVSGLVISILSAVRSVLAMCGKAKIGLPIVKWIAVDVVYQHVVGCVDDHPMHRSVMALGIKLFSAHRHMGMPVESGQPVEVLGINHRIHSSCQGNQPSSRIGRLHNVMTKGFVLSHGVYCTGNKGEIYA